MLEKGLMVHTDYVKTTALKIKPLNGMCLKKSVLISEEEAGNYIDLYNYLLRYNEKVGSWLLSSRILVSMVFLFFAARQYFCI